MMALPMKPRALRPDLERLLRESAQAYERMTPEQKEAMLAAQRKSWVVGEMMIEHPEMSREYVEAIYDKVCS